MQQPHLSQTSEKDHEGRDADMVTSNDDKCSPLAGTRREAHHLEGALHLAAKEGDAVVCLSTNQETEPPSRVTAPVIPLLAIVHVVCKWPFDFALPW